MDDLRQVSIKKDLGRLIAHALPAKLTFDQACMREGGFNEYHVHAIINEVVISNLSSADHWVQASYAHPALQDAPDAEKGKVKRGRRRELDFHIRPTKQCQGGSLAIEVKWTTSAHSTWRTILADIYRLKLVAMAEGETDCILVICGRQQEVVKLVQQIDVASQARALGSRRYLKPLRLVSMMGEDSGGSSFRPIDENGKFLGGDSVRSKLPLRTNGKRWVPESVKTTLLGESVVGKNRWATAVWRIT